MKVLWMKFGCSYLTRGEDPGATMYGEPLLWLGEYPALRYASVEAPPDEIVEVSLLSYLVAAMDGYGTEDEPGDIEASLYVGRDGEWYSFTEVTSMPCGHAVMDLGGGRYRTEADGSECEWTLEELRSAVEPWLRNVGYTAVEED